MFSKCAFHRFVILTFLLSATFCVFTGCERIAVDSVFQYEDLDFIDIPWEIVSVNDQPIESILTPVPEEGSPPSTFDITSKFVFDATGKLNGELIFTVSEQYPVEPPRSLTFVITNTVTGEYTAGETTLTIDTQNVESDVAAILTPRDEWEKELEKAPLEFRLTVEQLQDQLAAESEMGLIQDESTFPFTVGVDYTHQTEQDTLTLSMPGEKLLFRKKTE